MFSWETIANLPHARYCSTRQSLSLAYALMLLSNLKSWTATPWELQGGTLAIYCVFWKIIVVWDSVINCRFLFIYFFRWQLSHNSGVQEIPHMLSLHCYCVLMHSLHIPFICRWPQKTKPVKLMDFLIEFFMKSLAGGPPSAAGQLRK